MQSIPPLTPGNYFHIYNRGINSCKLFYEPDNYEYFLRLYEKHVSPVADTFAWVLMPNHFHLLVRIKDFPTPTGFETLSGLGAKPPHQYFSNLFNAYTQAINKRFKRHGALFERPFKRKLIDTEIYLKQLILYIHNNPVHHGFCNHTVEYPWSSYLSCISIKPTQLQRYTVLGWFDDVADFKHRHNDTIETEKIEKWLEL